MSRKNGLQPVEVNGASALRTAHYRKHLYNLLCGRFDIECDECCDEGYILHNLLIRGRIAFINTPQYGPMALRCNTYGLNVMNLPTHVRVVAPLLPEITAEILGDDCVLYHTPRLYDSQHFMSFSYYLDMYANQLAEIDAAISVNLMNSKLAYVAEAESKAQADTIKKVYDKVAEGEPLVVYRAGTGLNIDSAMNIFFNNLKQNYIVDLLIDAKRSIMNEFLTAIGINNSPVDRNERVTTVETNSNNEELETVMYRFKKCLEHANEERERKFPGANFKIEIREPEPQEGVIQNDFNGNDSVVGNNKQ